MALRTIHVSPAPAPAPAPPAAVFPLSFFDVMWIGFPAVERLFFFPIPTPSSSRFHSEILPALESSLAVTLATFLPLAAHLRCDEDSDIYELVYAHGDGVELTVAESEAAFDDLALSDHREFAQLQLLLPTLPSKDSSLAVRVTVFPGKGFALGIAYNHACCDGTGIMHFLRSWADACRRGGAGELPPPVLDRSLIRGPIRLLKFGKAPLERLGVSPGTIFTTFKLSPGELQQIKNAVDSFVRKRNPAFRCSTAMAAYGFMWACHIRAKAKPADYLAGFVVGIDYRRRWDPPLPEKYFGSCVYAGVARVPAEELVGEDGYLVACEAVAGTVEKTLGIGIEAQPAKKKEEMKTMRLEDVLSVAGSNRLGAYEVDFGWGRPARMDIASVAANGALAVAESRDGDGGVEIAVGRLKEETERFVAAFAAAVARLRSTADAAVE